ncbi:TIR domain-containing protein [Spirosoma sp. HMF4905]|uniref:TIR domain-containing protein n=1 Tax=Spirosoma arboris TaxID=2682092 RepID=A0A7K1SQA9_9BACT|nr:toll/interleukin-1 receptor domain-containing protein [Spirosoma arboris]MVM35994.1 TIR domain-containing protein [Spirosoma arboris]
MNNQDPWRVFYSYAHKDKALRDKLSIYLAPLVRQQLITEWHDRQIQPGANWNTEITAQLDSADLILLLLSADFLASDYCFGVEVEKAFARAKHGEAKVMVILLRPCLWKESIFSELQLIPNGAKPVTSWSRREDALLEIASEIEKMVKNPPPKPLPQSITPSNLDSSSLSLVRYQVQCYAKLYERTRQRMVGKSDERTKRMNQIFEKMRNLANASYPLLDELIVSPSPGERLAAVSILQVFTSLQHLQFLVQLIGKEKPFIGREAANALSFAAEAFDPKLYPQLLEAIKEAQAALKKANADGTHRQSILRNAEQEIQKSIEILSVQPDKHN